MKNKHILILGGYGSTGLPIAQFLLSQTDVSLTLAGRNLEKAKSAAEKLNAEHGRNHVNAAYANARDSQSLRKAFDGMDMVVVASSTSEYAETVARSAMEAVESRRPPGNSPPRRPIRSARKVSASV